MNTHKPENHIDPSIRIRLRKIKKRVIVILVLTTVILFHLSANVLTYVFYPKEVKAIEKN